ncbi:MAG TPA: patatin-like phospholipase family protein [Casimicrobiaceae bacterium]
MISSRTSSRRTRPGTRAAPGKSRPELPGQVVLVLQGGGALGAYQVGVYEAMHEASIEPDWVIGTSIGAINAALIAGNEIGDRFERLREFWARVEIDAAELDFLRLFTGLPNVAANVETIFRGIPAFFTPHVPAWLGSHVPLGAEAAAYYTTAPLRSTLTGLIDLAHIRARHIRLTVGAVNVRNGEMRYFDSRDEPLTLDHVIASGALPPAFPAVRIGGDPYWDGGIYSNTPIEAVLDDNPRRDSVIFAVQMWNPEGPDPETLWQVMGRQKDIQYASRSRSHIARQKQIHHLRHVIRELAKKIPDGTRDTPEVRELASWGCGTTMHVVRLIAPKLDGEDHTKDIDFTAGGIESRWRAGYDDTKRMLAAAPWRNAVDPVEGVVIHDDPTRVRSELARGIDGFAGRTR